MRIVQRERAYRALFDEFFEVYRERPIASNAGGMQLPHMFATWVFLKEFAPEVVIESGVWRGQSTWLIERSTTADIVAIDLDLTNRKFVSERARYSDIDFSHMDFTSLPKAKTLVFFDDHVNAFRRLMQGRAWGFENFIFEDNYPPGISATPSLKQMLDGSYDALGTSRLPRGGLRNWAKRMLRPRLARFAFLAERYDPISLRSALGAFDMEYEEFPPLHVFPKTRWNTDWRETYGELAACLDIDTLSEDASKAVLSEGMSYTSLCNVRPVLP
jgi:hypothetical protein